ncbi:MAG: AMP-binding protein [Kribbellaceae bacterium]|nr:AMP-binding protein [Kribbellaceae bacterium]
MAIDFASGLTPLRELCRASQENPDEIFITVDGKSATYAEAFEVVMSVRHGLAGAGLEPGERVIIMAPNRLEAVWTWLGVQAVGAIDAPISTEAPGAFLRYLASDLQPKAAVGTRDLLKRLREAAEVDFDLAIVIGPGAEESPLGADTTHIAFDDLHRHGGTALSGEVELPSAAAAGTIMYSSGTTGPSKGVVLTQGYFSTLAFVHIELDGFEPGYRIYCVQPLCHVDGRSAVIAALHLRGHVYLGTRFSASRFWDEIETHDVDVFYYVGTMIHLIHKQPPRPLRNPGRPRVGIGSATPGAIQRDFESRFNVELIEGYGMTEFGVLIAQRRGGTAPGHLGDPPAWVQVMVVDENDDPVPDGEAGQLVARPLAPHLHMLGYWGRPEATVAAWQGLWFHTGDVVRRRPDGHYEYVGRLKDSIRRRGENVSAWEVEQAATRHADVLEAAAIGVPSEVGDEDVALLVVARPGTVLDPIELRGFLARDLPKYALPRFIEIVNSLPKTPSERIAKGIVKERGIGPTAFDAEASIRWSSGRAGRPGG